MTTQHTPGPWEVRKSSNKYFHVFGPLRDHLSLEARSHGIKAQTKVATVDYPNSAERNANAHLIAAAPELLITCERLTKFMIAERDCHYEGCSDPEGNIPDAHDNIVLDLMDKDIDQAQAAIAKARGEE